MKVWCSGWKKALKVLSTGKQNPGKCNWEGHSGINHGWAGGGGAYRASWEYVNVVMVQHFPLWIPDIPPPLCATKASTSLHVRHFLYCSGAD